MPKLPLTPSQTVGPYFSMKLKPVDVLAGADVPGRKVRVEGRVLDGDGNPVEDALIEIWQANAAGRYRHPGDTRAELPLHDAFTGHGRVHSDFKTGEYAFTTVKPGRVPDPAGGLQAPHLSLIVTARGVLLHMHTRMYFGDEPEANADDFVLRRVPAERRSTLIAEVVPNGETPTYRFDVRLQGDGETVFFDL
ncbi:MAG TPA: protocatechuate 3,4-dioxygenase subunit alpha [Thermoanaerobaculia bacterium]|jgi:protocatechuate 3,4-dioxygenase alpha subunit